MTTEPVTLQRFDLYPKPKPGTKLAVRMHRTRGDELQGCVDKQAASPACVTVLAADTMPVIAPVGGHIANYSLTVVHEPASNGAYFLGEPSKFVHVSPQRFGSIMVKGTAPCGLAVALQPSKSKESITLVCVDPSAASAGTTVAI